jgi:hypothetical protein
VQDRSIGDEVHAIGSVRGRMVDHVPRARRRMGSGHNLLRGLTDEQRVILHGILTDPWVQRRRSLSGRRPRPLDA